MELRSKSYSIDYAPLSLSKDFNNSKRVFDTNLQHHISFELHIAKQHNSEPFFTNPLHLDVSFFMGIPKNGKQDLSGIYHSSFPHIDNLVDYLVNALCITCISNRSLIVSMSVKKIYDKKPRTTFTITELAHAKR